MRRVSLLFESFAYRRGVPGDADFVFDARCLPNPHWDATLRPLSGRDAGVRDYLEAQPDVAQFVEQVSAFLDTWLPRLQSEARAATSPSPSAAPAAAIARSTWPSAWPSTPRSRAGRKSRCTIASWTEGTGRSRADMPAVSRAAPQFRPRVPTAGPPAAPGAS